MQNISTKLHYQVIPSDNFQQKIILESFDNINFEMTILDLKSLKTIHSKIFKDISNDSELIEQIKNDLNRFTK